MEEGLSILLIGVLLLLSAFFVASEFAIVKVRRTRMEQLTNEGNKSAKIALNVIDELDAYLSACQLGITITSLGIGWLGEPAVASLLKPLFINLGIEGAMVHTLSFIIAFSTVTFLHVVLGELVPKTMAIQKTERIALLFVRPLVLFNKIMYPFIWALNETALFIVRLFGVEPNEEENIHSEEEIKMILKDSGLDTEEKTMINNVFNLQDRIVREIMVHRKEMHVVYLSDPLEESLETIKKSKHSRFPVCGEDRDDIVGYINVKDIYKFDDKNKSFKIEDVMRETIKVYETSSIQKALKRMQDSKHQLAIVIDEYGGVSGLVTIEDIVEELVGEIQDEFDEEKDPFEPIKGGMLVDASVLLDEVEEKFDITLEEIDGIDTIGGYILTKIDLPPKVGQKVIVDRFEIKIVDTDGSRIITLQFKEIEKKKEEVFEFVAEN